MRAASRDNGDEKRSAITLICFNCFGLVAALIVGEIRHRCVLAGEVDWDVKIKRNFTKVDFASALRSGQKLVILD